MYTNPKNEFYADVRYFFFTGKYTQREISKKTGVPERTIRNWVKDGCWSRKRENAKNASAVLVENFINQLVELQNVVASRTPGDRWPRDWEADIQCKILNNIMKMKNYPAEEIASFGSALAPISDVVFEDDPTTETEKAQMPFQEPLRTQYMAYESEGIELHYRIADSALQNAQIIEDEQISYDSERPESGHEAATSGHSLSNAEGTQTAITTPNNNDVSNAESGQTAIAEQDENPTRLIQLPQPNDIHPREATTVRQV